VELSEYSCNMFSSLCAQYIARNLVLNILQFLNTGLGYPIGIAVVQSSADYNTHYGQSGISGDAFKDVTKRPAVVICCFTKIKHPISILVLTAYFTVLLVIRMNLLSCI